MSVIIRLQNLPWSANAMDIRTFFRGLSIPEGGVHIVGGEQGDAFIAFSTDEDARQAMMNDCGKIKEVQVKLLLSSRSEMHKVIEAARQSVSFVQIAQPIVPVQQPQLPPSISGLLAQNIKLPLGLPQGFPLPKIEPPIIAPVEIMSDSDKDRDLKRGRDGKNNDHKSTRSRSRSRDRKDRNRDKKDKRDRSRSRDRSRDRERRRRDRSRSRDKRDRRRDRKDRSRDRDRSKESTDSRVRKDDKKMDNFSDTYNNKMPQNFVQNKGFNARGKEGLLGDFPHNNFRMDLPNRPPIQMGAIRPQFQGNPRINQNNNWSDEQVPGNNLPLMRDNLNARSNTNPSGRFNDDMAQIHRLQELDERRNPNAFQHTDNIPYNSRNGPRVPFSDNRMPFQNAQEKNNHHEVRNRYPQDPPPRGMCVKMQNLLSSIGYADIRRFFTGNFISNQGLKIINNDNGKRSGTAYVRFFQQEGKQNALRKNGQLLKGRPIVISHLSDEEFDLAIDSYRPNKESECSGDENDSQKSIMIIENDDNDEYSDEFKVLLLEDLPAFAKEHDIIKMFSDYSLLSIMLIVTKDVRKQYLAYVQFVNADDAKAALQNKSKHLIGHKLIKVSPCSEAAFEIVKANQNSLEEGDAETNASEVEDSENYTRNDTATASRDPRQRRFENRQEDSSSFAARNPKPYTPVPVQNLNPRFPWRAGNTAVVNPPFVDRDLGPPPVKRPPLGEELKLDCGFLKGLPLGTTNNDILDFFADINVVPTKIHLMLTIQGEPSGDCFCEFIDVEEALAAASKHNTRLGANSVSVELVSKQVVDDALGIKPDNDFSRGFRGGRGFANNWGPRRMRAAVAPHFHNGGRGGHRFMGPVGEAPFANDNLGADSFGVPGCVLALENVPFRASIDEILDFFREFNLTQNHMIRRFNENGHPTGDVRICLRTPVEAQHAFQKLNLRCIRDRTITMTIL